MPARSERKILKSGDSKVVALPPDWIRAMKARLGDAVDILYNSIVLIKTKNLRLDPDFLRKEFEIMLELEAQKEDNVE